MSDKKEIEEYTKKIWNDTKEELKNISNLIAQAKELKDRGEDTTDELTKEIAQILGRDPIQKLTEQRENQPGKEKDGCSERLPNRLRSECYTDYENFKDTVQRTALTEFGHKISLDKFIEALGRMLGSLGREVTEIELYAKANMKIDLS